MLVFDTNMGTSVALQQQKQVSLQLTATKQYDYDITITITLFSPLLCSDVTLTKIKTER